VKSAINGAPKLHVVLDIVASIASSMKTTWFFGTISTTSLAASTAALPISAIWHMLAFYAIAVREAMSPQLMRRLEKLFGCLALAAIGGPIISASMARSSNH
jgi:hypothetical protein